MVGRRQGIVKASDEDIKFLAKAASGGAGESGSDPVELAGRWVEEYGLGLAVITLGPGGGAAVEPGGNITRVPGFPTKVVDTVGAGDTFMAGLGWLGEAQSGARGLLGTRHGRRIHRLLRRGPQPPTSAEVDDLIAEKA